MFSTTYLGHQGWLVRTDRACVLIDPLLDPEIGPRAHPGLVYPPRRLNLALFPRVDAVIFSHEHEDHFDPASLDHLARDVAVYGSARSSTAMRRAVTEAGFDAQWVHPGQTIEVADLSCSFFSPDHVRQRFFDEWDTLGFLVWDRAGDGSLFSTVDIALQPADYAKLREVSLQPGVVTRSNNCMNWSFLEGGKIRRRTPAEANHEFVAGLLEAHAELHAQWGVPQATLLSGGGVSFCGKHEWLNRHVFDTDSDVACRVLQQVYPQESFTVPAPGHTLHLADGRLVSAEHATPFLQAAPAAEWPNRRYEPSVRVLKSLTPLTGKKQLPDEHLPELEAGLNELARMLYGGPEFRALYSLRDVPGLGRRPTFALVLLADDAGGAYVYEYEPQSSSFVCVRSANPVTEYIAGCELWATDLLALFRGEFGPSCLFFGNTRIWSAAPERFRLSLMDWMAHFHPLRMPEPCLARYRRELRAANPHHHAIIQSNSRALSRVASR